jgi:ankyrin repeat protein
MVHYRQHYVIKFVSDIFVLQTGLTPLMEAASGGYVEVGRVLLDKGADVNAPPVPSSRDTALNVHLNSFHFSFKFNIYTFRVHLEHNSTQTIYQDITKICQQHYWATHFQT